MFPVQLFVHFTISYTFYGLGMSDMKKVREIVGFMESRLERMVQHGNESCRHMMQIVEEFNEDLCSN